MPFSSNFSKRCLQLRDTNDLKTCGISRQARSGSWPSRAETTRLKAQSARVPARQGDLIFPKVKNILPMFDKETRAASSGRKPISCLAYTFEVHRPQFYRALVPTAAAKGRRFVPLDDQFLEIDQGTMARLTDSSFAIG